MEEEIDKVKTWAEENVQPDDTDDKPEEKPSEGEGDNPEEKPLEGENDAGEGHEGSEGEKPEDKKADEGEGAKGFGVEGHTPKGVQERINELSRGRREDRETIARLQAEIEALKKEAPKPKEKDRNDFANDEEWINYISQKKATEMFNKNIAEWEFKKEMEQATPLMKQREEEARKSIPDFDDVMSQPVDLPVDRDTFLYVAKSEKSAMINYSLRKVPSLRQQFINTPVENRLEFVKGVEKRLLQIDAEVEEKKKAAAEASKKAPAVAENEIRLHQGDLRQPMDVRHKDNKRLDPATCSMQDWMDRED